MLQTDQCHVTVSGLAIEWHWHRATVRAFLNKLEEMGYIRRTRFAKSVVITVTFASFSSGETPASYTGQTETGLADDLDKSLSERINGNLSDEDMGEICGQYHEAGLKRAIRNSRFDDPTDFLEFFHKEPEGDKTSLLEASKISAKMIPDAGNDGTVNSSSETDMLAIINVQQCLHVDQTEGSMGNSMHHATTVVIGNFPL